MTKYIDKLNILTGCFGSGKSEVAVQMALNAASTGTKARLIDMDLVNPYFKSSQARQHLEQYGVEVTAPVFAGSGIETPSLPPLMRHALTDASSTRLVDLGGDTAGAVVMGSFSETVRKGNYEFLFVFNPYRPFTPDAESAAKLMAELSACARLEMTGIINNAHLMTETTHADLLYGDRQSAALSKLTGLPILYHCVPVHLAEGAPALSGDRLLLTLDNRPKYI